MDKFFSEEEGLSHEIYIDDREVIDRIINYRKTEKVPKKFSLIKDIIFGLLNKGEREKIIEEFHSIDSRFKVVIANPFAVSESILLHKACHTAIYMERTFNAAKFLQSKDRIHRVGLDQNTITNYYYLLSVNSIDETIWFNPLKLDTLLC